MAGLLWCALLVLLAGASAHERRVKRIVGGNPAQEPPRTQQQSTISPPSVETPKPAVFVRKEEKAAVVRGVRKPDGSYAFLGIRYAEPPTGPYRLQRPIRLKLKGEVDARRYGPPCPQWHKGKTVGDEDCLFLNVYSPKVPSSKDSQPLPVFLWIHGGNFKTGSAAQYLPTDLVKKGLVVVTVQYRLGALGFFTAKRNISVIGNEGLLDVVAAAQWVRKYIKFFGGDPDRITAGGQGSGASCAGYLAFNSAFKHVKGLVLMSGSPVSPFAIDGDEARSSEEIARLSQCNPKSVLKYLNCLRDLPLSTLLNTDLQIEEKRKSEFDFTKQLSNLQTVGPVLEGPSDGRFLPSFLSTSPLTVLKKASHAEIPLLIGVTKNETGGGIRGRFLDRVTQLLKNPAFLKGGIFKELLEANTGLYEDNRLDEKLAKLFDSNTYVQYFSRTIKGVLSAIQQVMKHTTDAFFNLPAFITASLWSESANVYLYSFEYESRSIVNKILEGINLVSKEDTDEKSCHHGDDLQFVFDIQSLEGELIANGSDWTEADKKVKGHFTTIVSEFVKTGVPKIAGRTWESFSREKGTYAVIDEEPDVRESFKECEMGLWTGDTRMLQSVQCGLQEAGKLVTDTVGAAGARITKRIDSIQEKLPVPIPGVNELSKGIKKETAVLTNVTKLIQKPPIIGGLGGSSGAGLGGDLLGALSASRNRKTSIFGVI